MQKTREDIMNSPSDHGMTRRETLAGAGAVLLDGPRLRPAVAARVRAPGLCLCGLVHERAQRKARGNGINAYRIDRQQAPGPTFNKSATW